MHLLDVVWKLAVGMNRTAPGFVFARKISVSRELMDLVLESSVILQSLFNLLCITFVLILKQVSSTTFLSLKPLK